MAPDRFQDAVIDLEIAPDGGVRFHVSGLPGPACEELEAVLLQILKGEVLEKEYTAEFYQQVQQTLGQRLKAWVKG